MGGIKEAAIFCPLLLHLSVSNFAGIGPFLPFVNTFSFYAGARAGTVAFLVTLPNVLVLMSRASRE